MRVRACLRALACVRARVPLRARKCVCSCISIGLRLRARGFDVCVCSARVCAPRRGAHSRGAAATCGMNSSARAARVVSLGAIGRARALQVSPGRAPQAARCGLGDIRTRPWSTPPAPSTSSAAATTRATPKPTSTTCGRAPTEVRGRTRSGVGGYLVGTQGVPQGIIGVPWGY